MHPLTYFGSPNKIVQALRESYHYAGRCGAFRVCRKAFVLQISLQRSSDPGNLVRCMDETLRISQETFSFAGKTAAILPARSRAESSNVTARAAIGAASKTKRNRRVRQEKLERSVPIIGVLRSATQDNRSDSSQRPQLQQMIAQASCRIPVPA